MKQILSALALTLAVAAPAVAQTASPNPREAMIKGGAQLSALAVYCGKVTAAQAKESKEKVRASIYGKGGDSTGFDALYDTSYDGTFVKAKSMPDKGKSACDRLDQLQQQGAEAAKKMKK